MKTDGTGEELLCGIRDVHSSFFPVHFPMAALGAMGDPGTRSSGSGSLMEGG